jgi:hypothetical protein
MLLKCQPQSMKFYANVGMGLTKNGYVLVSKCQPQSMKFYANVGMGLTKKGYVLVFVSA